jgi:TonB family protein
VISVREGVLLSLVAHAAMLLFVLFGPTEWLESSPVEAQLQPQQHEPIRFVQVMPLVERPSPPPVRPTIQSDLDRRSATRERAPVPENSQPFSRGNTPERIEGAPEVKAAGPETPAEAPAPPSAPPDATGLTSPLERRPEPPKPARGSLGSALRDLTRYLKDQNYDNIQGGSADQSADIQFDSKGVDFGPWLRRFAAQIRRNWTIPEVAQFTRGRVVLQFVVLRNGTIIGLTIAQPAAVGALTTAAATAIKMSNPTTVLPAEYPDDRVQFTVTFHYNENVRESP